MRLLARDPLSYRRQILKAPAEARGDGRPPPLYSSPGEGAAALDGVHVLVVDDQPDARELLAVVLGRAGAKVSASESAADALELLGRERVDVLVSDVKMPVEGGYTLVGRVRALPARLIPTIALTAYATEDDRRRALTAGFDAHVAKPVEPAELVSVITGLIARGGTQFT